MKGIIFSKMKTAYSFILIFLFKIVLAQPDSLKVYKNQIKLSPFRLVTNLRGLEISFERQWLKNRSTQFTTAYILDPFVKAEISTWKEMRGFSLGIEQKRFIDKSGYVAINYNVLACKFEDIGWFGYKSPKDSLERAYQYLDTINIRKITHTLTVRIGDQLILNHFVLDVNVGLGIRYRSVNHLNRLNSNDFMQVPRHPNIEYMQTVNGKYFLPNLSIGFKIGYRF